MSNTGPLFRPRADEMVIQTTSTRDWVEDVLEFHRKFGLTINETPSVPSHEDQELRDELIKEEFREWVRAPFGAPMADALADLIYVAIGTAITYGIDLRPVWEEVHRTNMAKTGGGRRRDGKVLKPEGWQPPDISAALAKGRLKKC